MDTNQLATELRSVIALLHKTLRRQAGVTQEYSLTETETIGLLSRQKSMLPTELASATRITTQSMSQILKKLEENGIIIRTPSEQDKRKVYISLSAQGKKLIEKYRMKRDEWLNHEIETLLSTKEKDVLMKAVPILHKLINTNQL